MSGLNIDEAEKILRQTDPRRNPNREERWPDRYKDELRLAIDNDADEVSLGGIVYSIRWKGDEFFLKRVDGQFAPCGWFERNWVGRP